MTEPTPYGQSFVSVVDPDGTRLTSEQRDSLLRLENQKALRLMCHADLSNTKNPDIAKVSIVFETLLRRFEFPAHLMAWRYFVISQCQVFIDSMAARAADVRLTDAERSRASRLQLESIQTIDDMIARATVLATRCGVLKEKGSRAKVRQIKPAKNVTPKLGG